MQKYLTPSERDGEGAGPIFDDTEVKHIISTLLPHLAAAAKTKRSSAEQQAADTLSGLLDDIDALSDRVTALEAVDSTTIRALANEAEFLWHFFHPEGDVVWSTAQQVMMAEMSIRLRRYARQDPGNFGGFIQDIRDRVDNQAIQPILHW